MSWDWHEKNHYTLHQWRSGPSHWRSSEIYLLCSSRDQQHFRVVFPWHLAPWHQSSDSQFKFPRLKLSRECLIRHQIRVWNGVTTKCFLQFGNSKPSLTCCTVRIPSTAHYWLKKVSPRLMFIFHKNAHKNFKIISCYVKDIIWFYPYWTKILQSLHTIIMLLNTRSQNKQLRRCKKWKSLKWFQCSAGQLPP